MIALAGQVQALTQVVNDPAQLRAAVTAIQPGDSRASFGELARYLRTLSECAEAAARSASGQRSAKERHASRLRRPAPGPRHHAGLSSRGRPRAELDRGKRGRAAPRLRSQAREDPGHHRGLRHARREAHRHAAAERTRRCRRKTVDVPANGRAQVEFLGLDAPYGFSRGEVRIDGADALPGDDRYVFLGRARRSAQGVCSSTTDATRAPNSTSAPRWIPRATAHSRWNRSVPNPRPRPRSRRTRSSC